MRSPGALTANAILLAAVACFTACQQSPPKAATVHGPLPPPPTGELKYAGAPPKNPFGKETGNYFARTVYETDGPGNSHIEVRDLLIPPHAKSSVAALPGPAVFDIASGKVTIMTGDKPQATAMGTISSLPPGQVLQFENADSRPAIVRLYILRGR